MGIKVLAITQARMGSSRLPGKVLKTAGGKTLLETHLDRLSRSALIEKLIVATTTEAADRAIADLADQLGYDHFRGSETDVLDRYYQAAKRYDPEYVVRITSDCPLIDPDLVDDVIRAAIEADVDYANNVFDRTYPDGTDAEIVRFSALERAWWEAKAGPEREHVTPFIIKHSSQLGHDRFTAVSVKGAHDFSQFRLTIDYPEDLELLEVLIDQLGADMGWKDYADYLSDNPAVYAINCHFGFGGTGANKHDGERKK